ncbi:hypothetical protein VMCG_10522 [Cytospora schulzeri]|uniref:Uncharacterized protein n=1 Tax=Cytospora schulzeri TaxID=448051 RepID=A0A423VBW9_9PEZI|nr:hypothetical protein VMCG_10522 [Valsa malicola]
MGDPPQGVAVELIFDFDGTITTEDTIASLANAAMAFQVDRGSSRSEITSAWKTIQQSYAQDLTDHHETYVAPDGKPPETPAEIAMARLWPIRHIEEPIQIMMDRVSGRQRRHIELASLARIKDEGLFQGIWPDYLFSAGQQDRLHSRVRIREGFESFFKQARQQDHDMHVLSVNWSADYIKGVLGNCDMTSVIANKVNQEDGSISASGAFEEPVEGGLWPDVLTVANDKVVALRNLYWRRKLLVPDKELLFIYFGDSTTDVECFVEVGGVIISDNEDSGLLRMLRQELDYHVPHVSVWKEGGFTCWARDFVVFQCNHSSFGRMTRKCFLQLAFENGECGSPCGKRDINPIQSVKVHVLCHGCLAKVTDQVHKIAVIKQKIAEAKAKLNIDVDDDEKEGLDNETIGSRDGFFFA